MGKPKNVQAAKIGTDYNWGDFGSASSKGINLGATPAANLQSAQLGTSQYLDELLNPSYNSGSFKARQDILDANNQQYANQLGANAIDRGARGSATQNILNSIMANRNNDMRNAMTQEDARIRSNLAQTQGVEGNYFNQSNEMANNILRRLMANQGAQNQANQTNTANYNQWKDNLIGGAVGIGTGLAGAGLSSYLSPAVAGSQMTGNTYQGALDPSGTYAVYGG